MKKLLRLMLLCLMMLVIPFQGALAASITCCATGHEEISISAPGAHAHDAGEHGNQHDHEQTAGHGDTEHECCVAAAILNSLMREPLRNPASEKIDLIFSSFAGFIGEGPDKPPRS